jgi:tetratricopeptide (TPR) repeat protein
MIRVVRLGGMALALALASCASEADKEALALYEKAQAQLQGGNHEAVVADLTRALSLTGDHWTSFTDGSVHYLRGQANEALERYDAAIGDYTEAINRGNKRLSSYVLNSDPKPYAKNKFMRNQLASYYEVRGKLYLKLERQELADADGAVVKRLGTLPTSTKEQAEGLLSGRSARE